MVPKSAILAKGEVPARVRYYKLYRLLPRDVQPIFDQIVMHLWPLTDAEKLGGRDAARLEKGDTKIKIDGADEPVPLSEINLGAVLLYQYPPHNESDLRVWANFIRPETPTPDVWNKFWELLIAASGKLAENNAFKLAKCLVMTVHMIDEISASVSPIDRLAATPARNARTTVVNKACKLASDMKKLGIGWSVWDLVEWWPELADASPRRNKFLVQPKLDDIPDMVGLLRILAAKLDATVQRSAIGQPTKKSARRRLFADKLNKHCESIFGTPSHKLVAEAATLIFQETVNENSVRREFSRAKAKRAKAVKQNDEKPTSVYNSRGDKRSSRQLGQTSQKTSTKIDKRVTRVRTGKAMKSA